MRKLFSLVFFEIKYSLNEFEEVYKNNLLAFNIFFIFFNFYFSYTFSF